MSLRSNILVLFFLAFWVSDSSAQRLEFTSGGGPVTLDINAAPAGGQPVDAIDQSTEIHWDADFGTASKLTVSTLAIQQSYRLFVRLNVTSYGSGTVADMHPEVELVDGMFDEDLLTNIPADPTGRQGYGTLIYRASALVSDGNSTQNGDDSHQVTFTILAQ